jgi:hypothetical protein
MHVLKAVVTGIAKEKQKRETKELEEILARGDTRRKEVAMKQEAEQPLPTSSFGQNTFEQQTKQQHVARTSSSHHSNLSLVEQMIANSALLQAAAKGNMRDVMMYVERGADINTEDNKGDTAITLALDWENWDIANYLLQMGARINDEVGPLEKTDLDIAAEEGHLEKAMWLRFKMEGVPMFIAWMEMDGHHFIEAFYASVVSAIFMLLNIYMGWAPTFGTH